jgi:hypothetical protein
MITVRLIRFVERRPWLGNFIAGLMAAVLLAALLRLIIWAIT